MKLLAYLIVPLFLFAYGCTTVNNYYYTIVEDTTAHMKKLLTGKWVLTNCTGFDSSLSPSALLGAHRFFSFDTATNIITVGNYSDTSLTPLRTDHYAVDSMVLNIDSNGYYKYWEAYSKNGAASQADSLSSTWTYIWTNDSSSMLLLNPTGVTGIIFNLSAQGFASYSGNLIVQSLDSTQMVLAAKTMISYPGTNYYRVDVRYTLRKH